MSSVVLPPFSGVAPNREKKSRATLRDADSRKLCSEKEDDYYDFLSAKPELGWKEKKGRRHAGEVLLAKKVANEAYLIKSVVAERDEDVAVAGGGRPLGKKRRTRLISEKAGGDFKLSVPYSLNRKGRWSTLDSEGTDLLQSDYGNLYGKEQRMKISVLEADYTLKDVGGGSLRGGVKSYHELDTQSGVVASHYSKSKRGANLKSLIPPPEDDALVPDSPALKPIDLNIHYTISKPHPVLAAKGVSRGKSFRSGRRMGNVFLCDTSIKSRDSAPALKSTMTDRMLESMTDENCVGEELLHSYARPERLYSLADFVKESAPTTAVIVRNKSIMSIASDPVATDHISAATNASSDEFEMVSHDDSQSEKEKVSGQQSEQLKKPPLHTAIRRCRVEEVRRANEWFFEHLKWSASSASIHNKKEWLHQCASVTKLEWIDASRGRFLVDLSGQITADSLLSPVLVCSIGYHEAAQELSLTLNAAFKAPTALCDALKALNCKSLCGLLAEIAEVFKHSYGKEVGQHTRPPNDTYPMKTAFNSSRLATQAQPIGLYKLLEDALQLDYSTHFERAQSSLSDSAEEEDDFEIVELDNAITPRSLSPSVPAGVEILKEICECCHSESTYFLLPALCGHKFCGGCLHDELLRRVVDEQSGGELVLACLADGCDSHIELRFLPLALPLPIVKLCALAHFISTNEISMLCDDCPQCGQSVVAELKREDFHQLSCAKCAIHWCRGCRQAPHWPLSCKQSVQWGEKFEHQYLLDKARINASIDATLARSDQAPNAIAQEFSLVCSESRSRRCDERLSVQLAKHMRRLAGGDRQTEQRFTKVRKTALHLLEYGFSWLYLTRGTNVAGAGARPKEWTTIKSLLSQLRKRSDSLESEVLFAGSLTDSSGVLKKVERTELLTEQLLMKLHTVVWA